MHSDWPKSPAIRFLQPLPSKRGARKLVFRNPLKRNEMIGYVTLGTNDMARAAAFYDDLLGVLGATRIMDGERFIAWSVSPTHPAISVIKPYDGHPATVGNGVMVALAVENKEQVDALYNKPSRWVLPTKVQRDRAAPAFMRVISAIWMATSSMYFAWAEAERA